MGFPSIREPPSTSEKLKKKGINPNISQLYGLARAKQAAATGYRPLQGSSL
jgi:hypothetical protein